MVLGYLAATYYQIDRVSRAERWLSGDHGDLKECYYRSPNFYLAMIHTQMAAVEAFDWLEKSISGQAVELFWRKVEPHLESPREYSR